MISLTTAMHQTEVRNSRGLIRLWRNSRELSGITLGTNITPEVFLSQREMKPLLVEQNRTEI